MERALELADETGLDLVEVAPDAEPPVCKLLDFGKYKYEAQKKASEARKKQKNDRYQGGQIPARHRRG